jgi:hypothetical protein
VAPHGQRLDGVEASAPMRTATAALVALVALVAFAASVTLAMLVAFATFAGAAMAAIEHRPADHGDEETAPRARLERVRGDPDLANDPAAIDALARDLEAFPPGAARVEARMLVAEAWLGRMRRPEAALVELQAVAGDPAADPLTARLAEGELVQALVASGRIVDARTEAHARMGLLDQAFVRSVDRLARRRWLRRGAAVVLAAFAALSAVALARAHRRRSLGEAARALGALAPAAIPFLAFVAIAGAVLASRYESGNAWPFLLLGATSLPLVLVARAWGAVGSARPADRFARAVLCAATVLAAAFVLLDMVNPGYLEGFGL